MWFFTVLHDERVQSLLVGVELPEGLAVLVEAFQQKDLPDLARNGRPPSPERLHFFDRYAALAAHSSAWLLDTCPGVTPLLEVVHFASSLRLWACMVIMLYTGPAASSLPQSSRYQFGEPDGVLGAGHLFTPMVFS
jgi:hypothetical protein